MRNFSNIKRVVVKIGTNTLSKDGHIDIEYIANIASQIKQLHDKGLEVLLVSSGAIGMGAGELGLKDKVQGIKMRQACAAIGQPLLMHEYHKAFKNEGITIAQVLVTAWIMDNRTSYLNLRNSIETLLRLGCVPILNENDSISTAEIGSAFGDNDTLSALIASKVDADLLVLLTDIDRLYTADPKVDPSATPISAVTELTAEIENGAGENGSTHSTGGMKTKIAAVKIASNLGCRVVLANGRETSILPRIINGEDIGTVFMPSRRLSNRHRWILNSKPAGTIHIDDGAVKAIMQNKSLLPSGITKIDGVFKAGSVVKLSDAAKAVTAFSSDQLKTIAGKHTSEIQKQLGDVQRDVVAIPEDIVILEK
ncbi:MAG: glutamate 5-kinase [Sedimentisphaeraceae bacterium JB056]